MVEETETQFISATTTSQQLDNLDIDHVYSQKFYLQSSVKDSFKTKLNDGYLDKMLNSLGVVFFKSQIFHGENVNDQHICTIDFHLFSLECLNDITKTEIAGYVEELVSGFGEAVKLHTTETLTCGETKLRKPVYRYSYI